MVGDPGTNDPRRNSIDKPMTTQTPTNDSYCHFDPDDIIGAEGGKMIRRGSTRLP